MKESEDLEQLRKIIKEKEDQLAMKAEIIKKEPDIGNTAQLRIHRIEQEPSDMKTSLSHTQVQAKPLETLVKDSPILERESKSASKIGSRDYKTRDISSHAATISPRYVPYQGGYL